MLCGTLERASSASVKIMGMTMNPTPKAMRMLLRCTYTTPSVLDIQRMRSPPKHFCSSGAEKQARRGQPHDNQKQSDEELAAADDFLGRGRSPGPLPDQQKDEEHQRHGNQAQEECQQPVVDQRRQPQSDEESQHHRGHGSHHFDGRLDPGTDLRRGKVAHVGRRLPGPTARPGAWRKKCPSRCRRPAGRGSTWAHTLHRRAAARRTPARSGPRTRRGPRGSTNSLRDGAGRQSEEAPLDSPALELAAHNRRDDVAAEVKAIFGMSSA